MTEIVNPELELEKITAGDMLRNARTTGRRKREISTIAKQLCIREEFLQALEDGNYDVLPELVYILGFARNYAMELGLNPDEIVEKIKDELGVEPIVNPPHLPDMDKEDKNTGGKKKVNVSKNFKQIFNLAVFERVYSYVSRKWVWFFCGVFVFVVLLCVLIFSGKSDKSETLNNVNSKEIAIVEPEYRKSVRERFGNENRDGAEVILQAAQESWVKIEDGRGKTLFSRVLVPGDVYYVPAGKKCKATFGNVGGIDVWVDGKLVAKSTDNHTRKSDISMEPDDLLGKNAKSEKESESNAKDAETKDSDKKASDKPQQKTDKKS